MDIARLRTMISSHSARCLRQPVRLDDPAATRVPRTHIHYVGDVPEGYERKAVPAVQPNGAPARIRELHSGHDCMVTVPGKLAELLLHPDR